MNNDNKSPALPTRGPDISTDNSTLASTAQSDQQALKPPDESVRIEYLLDEIVDILNRHVSLPVGAPEALALSVARAHAMDAFQHSPLVALLSHLPASGKTTLLSVIGKLVPKPLFTSNATKAAVFRSIEKDRPTLLIDEADTFVDGDREFTGILNACHSREGVFVLRCVGDQHKPKAFRVWTPVFLAKLGPLPPTLQSRAIIIPMRAARPDEQLDRIGPDVANRLAQIGEQIPTWCAENMEKLRICNPTMPAGFRNRRADNWRPLLAIAELAGGEWPARTREAALALTGRSDQVIMEIEILSAIRSVFSETGRQSWNRRSCVRP